jgi:hypothetical protein
MENRFTSNSGGSGGAVLGLLLIAAGCVFLGVVFTPVQLGENSRPLYVILPGLAMVAISFARRFLAWLAIPGAMLTVVGLVMAAQQSLDLTSVWAYAWPLVVPGSVGLGVLIVGIATREAHRVVSGLWIVVTGLGLCAFFATFFAGTFGPGGVAIAPVVAIVFPMFLIVFGLAMLMAAILQPNRQRGKSA